MPIAGWWTALHTIGFVLFALMGVALWLLTAGLPGVFATVSRGAAVVFALFYDAGDAIAGRVARLEDRDFDTHHTIR